jgi:molybdopterin converting factor small subunit
MSEIRIPTPLRAYTEGEKQIQVSGATVGEALSVLIERFPELKPHLYDEHGELRQYVNIFVNDDDVRNLNGGQTDLGFDDRILIVPSIAGGSEGAPQLVAVDHNALRTNQAMIIALLLAAFITDRSWLSTAVAGIMLLGTTWSIIGFKPVYWFLRFVALLQPDVLQDNPVPHRFSQALGGVVLAGATLAFSASSATLGWSLVWLVIILAGLNLFGGFCVGCAVYYWLNRLQIPGFSHAPPSGVTPGRRPQRPE